MALACPGIVSELLHAMSGRPRGRVAQAAFVFVAGFLTIAVLAGVAVLTGSPFVFPSVGPTAFLLYFTPTAVTASPRHALLGHAVGLACGYAALWCTGLAHAPAATVMGVTWARVLAAALSLASTGALLILLRVVHAPAAATTLIVSLGIITRPWQLVAIEVAVALMVACGFAVNRLAGIPYPRWEAPLNRLREPERSPRETASARARPPRDRGA